MKKDKLIVFNTVTNVVILTILVLGGTIWADNNGVWIEASDVKGGTFGSDEGNPDFIFPGEINYNGQTLDNRFINVGETGDSILDNTIDSSEIQSNTLTNADIADGTIRNQELQDNAVNSAKVQDNTLTNADIADGTIRNQELQDNAVNSAKVQDNTLTNADIADGTIRNQELQDNAVNSAKVQDNTLTNADIADGTIRVHELQDNAVNSAKVQDNSLTNNDIQSLNWNKITNIPSTSTIIYQCPYQPNCIGASCGATGKIYASQCNGQLSIQNYCSYSVVDGLGNSHACTPIGKLVLK